MNAITYGLKPFERDVIRALVEDHLPQQVLVDVLDEGTVESYLYSGSGYYLTLRHPDLPTAPKSCSKPFVTGTAKGIDSGFVVFLGNHRLALECHSWNIDLPEDYRDYDVKITVA